MSVVRHSPHPLHIAEPYTTLCGGHLAGFDNRNARHVNAGVGESITCPGCRVVINMTTKCVAPHNYILARMP